VLRYYAGLSEAEVAAAMEVRKGLVKSYLARGMSSLRPVLEQQTAEE
jgi:DNA-directed RNA polymerase specialized sigma24 family protein